MNRYYLIDNDYFIDADTLFASMGHLVVFNPNEADAELGITIYFEHRDPESFSFIARALKTNETNYSRWPVKPGERFALEVESDVPVICQATIGWNNSKNNYSPDAETKSPNGVRECAKSYMAIKKLSREWYSSDSLVIDSIDGAYVRESEWAVILNPGGEPAQVTLKMHFDEVEEYAVEVHPERVKWLYMDDIARRNAHYGVIFCSDQPIAVQWLREVRWYDSPELMAFWSVPCVPGPLNTK